MSFIQPVRRQGKDGKSYTAYRARWEDPDGRERCKTFPLKRDAQRHLDEMTADMLTARYVDPKAGKVTVRTYATRWAASQRWEPSTAQGQESCLRRHVFPTFGDRPIGSIRTGEIREWVTGLTRTHAANTARGITICLFSILKAAKADKVIGEDPCDGVALPAKAKADITIPTSAQVRSLIEAAPAQYRAAVFLAAGAGLRQSEMTGLAVDRLVLPLGTAVLGVARGAEPSLRVDQQLSCVQGAPPVLKAPKTSSGRRTVPLADPVAEALAAHLAAFPVSHPWGLLFTTDDGGVLTRWDWSRIWRATVKAAGLSGVRYHDLRHYSISSMIRSGCSITEVREFAGHADSRTTLDTYGHLWEDSTSRVRQALNAAFRFGDDQVQAGALTAA